MYEKFLKEDGSLNVRLLPRPVYTKLVSDYRTRDEAIDEVFDKLYLTWDLEQRLEAMKRAGTPGDKAAAAQMVIDALDDGDWWRVMSAFEKAMARDFSDLVGAWSEDLDPVYDDQEERGWIRLQ